MRAVDWANEELWLLAERAVWWPRCKTLIVADTHFGKAAAFRNAGIPVPEETTHADLARLSALVQRHAAERLIVLGDFLHARRGRSAAVLDALCAWRASFGSLKVTLVRGNHDYEAGDPPQDLKMQVVAEPFVEGNIHLRHHAQDSPGLAVQHSMCGHIHPAVRIHGDGAEAMRLACFWVRPRTMVLPAFGSFTGTHVVQPTVGDRVFVIGPDDVVEVNGVTPRNRKRRTG